jgi:heavy metal translocating P-type ATPase
MKLCLHCGSAVSDRARGDYCCTGCQTVHELLTQSGLDRYYSILKKTGEKALPVSTGSDRQNSYTWLDQTDIIRDYQTPAGVRFYLEGVHCAACVWLVEKLPQLVPGITHAKLDLSSAVVTVQIDPNSPAQFSQAAQALHRIGYRPHPIRASEAEELQKKEDRKLLTQLGIAAAASGNIMLLAISLYAGADGAFARQFSWISFFLSIPVLFYSAQPFYRSSWSAFRSKQLSIDVPVALGLQVSFWVSVINLFQGNDHIYFDSVTALVFLLLSSRYLLRRVQRTSLNAANLAHFLMPATARRLDLHGHATEVSLAEVHLGDQVEVLPHDLIPADGTVLHGMGRVNQSLITGESRLEKISPGSEVLAGTQNGDTRLVIQITRSGRASRVGQILESMETTLKSRAPIEAFSDRVSRVFIAITLLLLPLVFWGGYEEGWQEGLDRALAVALVTCPCAFALATPLSFASVLGKAAKSGILIKGAEILERLGHIEKVFFDKTGTLTEGKFQVLHWEELVPMNGMVSPLVLALESQSRHPIARALRDHFQNQPVTEAKVQLQELEEIPAQGVQATWNGKRYHIGALQGDAHASNAFSDSRVFTLVGLYEDEQLLARFTLGDPVRSDAKDTLREVRNLGIQIHLLSGDSREAVQQLANTLEIPDSAAHSKMSPEGKKEILANHQNALMVGDGANDAVALATASVGIALQGGLEASIRASDIYLSRPGIRQIPALILIGKETLKVVKRNFAVSLGYNFITATAAALGKIDPLFAAVLMPLSSFAVFVSAKVGTRRMNEALREVAR